VDLCTKASQEKTIDPKFGSLARSPILFVLPFQIEDAVARPV
jgi:hypothetical protein